MKTLLEQLENEAQAISINDDFIRYFNLEIETNDFDGQDSENDDYVLMANADNQDYDFTLLQLKTAKYDSINESWYITDAFENLQYTIKLFKLETITPQPTQRDRLAIILEGGIVQGVISNNDKLALNVAVVDYDTDGIDYVELQKIKQHDGTNSMAYVVNHEIGHTGIDLNEVFDYL